MKKTLGSLILLAMLQTAGGCGGPSSEDIQRQSALEAYDAGNVAFDQKLYDTAKEKFAAATQSGLLTPDFHQVALIRLAVAQAGTGEADAGMAAIEEAEKAGIMENEVWFYLAKSYVLGKQGNRSAAQQAFQQARKLSPRVKPIKD